MPVKGSSSGIVTDRPFSLRPPARDPERYKPRQQGRRIKLTNDAFDIAKATGNWINRHDFAVAGRGKGDEAEVDEIAWKRRAVVHRYAGKCVRYVQPDERIERHEDRADVEIQQYRAHDPVVRDVSRTKH